MPNLAAIYAVGPNGEFGLKNGLPWSCADDMKRFKAITLGYASIIVGRSTFLSVGPLKDRKMIVVCKNPEDYQSRETRPNVRWMTVEQARCEWHAIVIGGAKLLEALLPDITLVLKSTIHSNDGFEADTYFNNNLEDFVLLFDETYGDHKFEVLIRE